MNLSHYFGKEPLLFYFREYKFSANQIDEGIV
jgi:hypothetical protein